MSLQTRTVHNNLRTRLNGRYCIYCGEHATTDEHIPPVVHTLGGYIVPACLECNLIAGTIHPENFIARAAYVKQQLKQRHSLPTPPITLDILLDAKKDDWLNMIETERLRRITEARLAWDAETYLKIIMNNEDFIREHVDPHTIASASLKRSNQRKVKHCKQCGTPFKTSHRTKQFCSKECSNQYDIINYNDTPENTTTPHQSYNTLEVNRLQPSHKEKQCKRCNNIFIPKQSNQRYCSKNCRLYRTNACHQCGKIFTINRRRRLFCSYKCRNLHFKLKQDKAYKIKTCKQCNNIFKCRHSSRLYCSNSCVRQNYKLKHGLVDRKPIACYQCNNMFTPKNDSARYCSEDCRRRCYKEKANQRRINTLPTNPLLQSRKQCLEYLAKITLLTE
jgi:hypothetical protein